MKALAFLLALPLLLAPPAFAQSDEGEEVAAPDKGLSISGDVILLSDYRFRGISRSDEDPALQAQLTISSPGGFYGGARGTSLHRFASRAEAEVDLYAGYGANLGLGTAVDVGMLYYVFPGGSGGADHFEPYASVSHTLGPVEATLGAKYAWAQDAIGGEDRLYLFGEVEAGIPATPLTLIAGAGRQDAGAFGRYWNWSFGARYDFGPLEAGLRYVDTDLAPLPGQDAGLVLSLGFSF
ncbi:MAG TPA: TorF family putative porin [Allosphingosinicella sp.]|nr:TorF family putative porin [Allosphingosinicella sp.]